MNNHVNPVRANVEVNVDVAAAANALVCLSPVQRLLIGGQLQQFVGMYTT
jgi:hypothetical protein